MYISFFATNKCQVKHNTNGFTADKRKENSKVKTFHNRIFMTAIHKIIKIMHCYFN